MTRRWFADAGRNIGIGLAIMLIVLASLMIAIFWPRPAGAYWSPYQWRTWSYCTKVWAKTYGSNDACRRFFRGN